MNPGFEQVFAMCAPWSYVLMFLSTIALSMMLERMLVLFFMFNLNVPLFMDLIAKFWREDRLDNAEKLALAVPRRNPFAQLARVALAHATATPERSRIALDGIERDGIASFQKRIRHFPFVAALAAAVGVAGTASLGGFSGLPKGTPRLAGIPVPTLPFAVGAVLSALMVLCYLVFTARARQMAARLAMMKTTFQDLRQTHPVQFSGD
jgi:hypothetical protein